ncbi:MAG: hypothetical protein J5I98_13240 [Phaeodactylibacter sp.]|nr:hypothetical protein [Phaeodactylibacter sp.]
MTNKLLLWVFGLALLAGCSSGSPCGNSKDVFLQNYYSLVDEAAAANLPASDDKWAKYDERFRAFVEECYDQYEPELSPKERRRFWSKSLKYYAQRYGDGAIKELGKKKDKASEKVVGEVEKIWTDTKEALKEAAGKVNPKEVLKPGETETE